MQQRFSFVAKMNVFGYKKGFMKKLYKQDGKFSQMFYVFRGSAGVLQHKCNFAFELEEYVRHN